MGLTVEDRSIKAEDGWPLEATLFRGDRPRMAVLVSAGTGFPRGFYARFARWMAERGGVVLTYDYRGIGGSRPQDLAAMAMDYPDWGRLDMPAALKALKKAAPGLPIFHVGHSVGGHFVGFMPNQGEIARHAFVSVGTGWWGGHHRTYNPMELFFWFGFGPHQLRRHERAAQLRHGQQVVRVRVELLPQLGQRRWSLLRGRYRVHERDGSQHEQHGIHD